MIIDPLIGPCGNVPILIRDDDTNFFTKADMIEAIQKHGKKILK
jgi:hypothetical protein